jgi:hypothetical protein
LQLLKPRHGHFFSRHFLFADEFLSVGFQFLDGKICNADIASDLVMLVQVKQGFY